MPDYLVHGAELKCSLGSQSAHLAAKEKNSTIGTGRYATNADCSPENIIGNFGICKCSTSSGSNRNTCVKAVQGPWRDVANGTFSSALSISNNASETDLGRFPLLLYPNSRLLCPLRGGVISPVTSGQQQPDYHILKGNALGDLRERVRKAIYAHYGFAVPTTAERTDFLNRTASLSIPPTDAERERRTELNNYYTTWQARTLQQIISSPYATTSRIDDAGTILKTSVSDKTMDRYNNSITAKKEQLKTTSNTIERTQLENEIKTLEARRDSSVTHAVYEDAKERIEVIDTTYDPIRIVLHQKEMAVKMIDAFGVSESSGQLAENDPYMLLAWLVLLEETREFGKKVKTPTGDTTTEFSNVKTTTERLVEEADEGLYEYVGIETLDVDTLNTRILAAKKRAERQEPEWILFKENIKGLGDAGFTGLFGYVKGLKAHTGLDVCCDGWDVAASNWSFGAPIFATKAGIVTQADWTATTAWDGGGGSGYGNRVYIDLTTQVKYNDTFYTQTLLYCHMHPLEVRFDISINDAENLLNSDNHNEETPRKADVRIGQYILPGKKVGNMGHTGVSSQPHLHFEIRGAVGGPYWDPRAAKNKFLPDTDDLFSLKLFKEMPIGYSKGDLYDTTLTVSRSTLTYSNASMSENT